MAATATGDLFDSVLELRHRLEAERDPDLDPDTEASFRAGIAGSETFVQKLLVGVLDGVAVGMAELHFSGLATNTQEVEAVIEVDPACRRRGVGRALVAAAGELARARGAASITAYNVNSPEAQAFWSRLGVERKSIERESRLWVANTDPELMNKWVEARMERAAGYRLEHFNDDTPVELRGAVAQLYTAMNDAPTDDLDREPDLWTEDEIVAIDELVIGRGRKRWTSVVLSPTGEPAGLTTLSTQYHKPRFAYQGNTVVSAAHRNRGLGRWLKADMWLRLREQASFVEAIDTDNAESNAAMLAINEAMGFEPLVEWAAWQTPLADLPAPG